MATKPTAVGLLCGIGSMLVGAKQAGFKVVGSVEDRGDMLVHDDKGRNSFTTNFRGAFLERTVTPRACGCTLAMGMPNCGGFSSMQYSSGAKFAAAKRQNAGNIPQFAGMLAETKPSYFVMDNLPPSLGAFSAENWHTALPDYDIFFELISNYHYGNAQKRRVRLFVIGAKKGERFTFIPGESESNIVTVAQIIGDINQKYGVLPNHDKQARLKSTHCSRGWTWEQMRQYMSKRKPGSSERHTVDKKTGHTIIPFGTQKSQWDGPMNVIMGAPGLDIHPITNLPLTLRERLRLMGFPDDFVLYGPGLNDGTPFDYAKAGKYLNQTGRCIPVNFCRYVSKQIMNHITDKPAPRLGGRFATRSPFVDNAKVWFCKNVGYKDQKNACRHCWIKECPIGTAGMPIQPRIPVEVAL